MIKRILAAAFLVLLALPALAGVNVRQNGDGTADWIGASDARTFGNCVGGVSVQIPSQLNNTASAFGLSPVTNAVIRGAYVVNPISGTNGDAIVRIFAGSATNAPMRFINSVTGNSSVATLNIATGNAGTVSRISTLQEAGATNLINNVLGEGQIIGLGSNGAATAIITGAVFIQACPR